MLLPSAGETLPSHVCYSCIYFDGDASLGMLLQGAYAQEVVQSSNISMLLLSFPQESKMTHSINHISRMHML